VWLSAFFALAVEWSTNPMAAPGQAAHLVRAWWEDPDAALANDEEWGATPEAQANIDNVKAAIGAPTGVVRPQPGGLVAVASTREQPAPSAGEDTNPP
jgi:hypothetical protein